MGWDGSAAETLLRVHGGRAVRLRMAAPAVAGDEAEQMGLASPGFQDVELEPCVWRKTGSRGELLVSAEAVRGAVGSLEFDSAKVLFATAAGVVVDAEEFRVKSMEPLESGGVAVCYRVELEPAELLL